MSQSAAFSLRKEGRFMLAKTAPPRRRNRSTRKAQRGSLGEMSKKVQEGVAVQWRGTGGWQTGRQDAADLLSHKNRFPHSLAIIKIEETY